MYLYWYLGLHPIGHCSIFTGSTEVTCCQSKLTFPNLDVKLMLLQGLQHSSKMSFCPGLVLECSSFGSSKPPILCHSMESKSCECYLQSILVLKGIINITQLLEEQFSLNFLLNFSIELRWSKLQKSF
ncbi:hypothetical protein M9H77_30220 [Catharanthus roseus]|uniref:Uncharacterized protein n=1 Tax=Catharanthus roseus TaxID=4058 RepID=A0ACC0A0V5_CATRO|nr:hypothetical protein M9H77_30220 [Catharanthus roseus]